MGDVGDFSGFGSFGSRPQAKIHDLCIGLPLVSC